MNESDLRAAAREVRDAILDSLPREPYPISPDFEARMEPLLRDPSAAHRPSARKYALRTAAAIALLCCTVGAVSYDMTYKRFGYACVYCVH